MIKQTTVIKRMIQDGWRPVALITLVIVGMLALSELAERFWGFDSFTVYMVLAAMWFVASGIKWAYDMKRDQIASEQREMLRSIERKHL